MKDYDKNKESSWLQYQNIWLKMLSKLIVNNFEGIEDAGQFNEDFIKKTIISYMIKLNMLYS